MHGPVLDGPESVPSMTEKTLCHIPSVMADNCFVSQHMLVTRWSHPKVIWEISNSIISGVDYLSRSDEFSICLISIYSILVILFRAVGGTSSWF